MEHLQPDLFGAVIDPLVVAAPTRRPGGVTWSQMKPRADVHCAHCELVAQAQARGGERVDRVRPAAWMRHGEFGCTLLLCGGHRRLLSQTV